MARDAKVDNKVQKTLDSVICENYVKQNWKGVGIREDTGWLNGIQILIPIEILKSGGNQ